MGNCPPAPSPDLKVYNEPNPNSNSSPFRNDSENPRSARHVAVWHEDKEAEFPESEPQGTAPDPNADSLVIECNREWNIEPRGCTTTHGFNQSLLTISLVTRRAVTWPLVLELQLFLSNNVRMSTACIYAHGVLRDHNSNNCTQSGNVFPSLYDFISASNLHIFAWKSRQIFSFSLRWPGGSTQ